MFDLQPMKVVLKRDLGNIRSGLIVEFPEHMARALVRRRLATVVGEDALVPDVVVSDEDVRLLEIELDPNFLAAAETADVAPVMELR